jgi:hypothetical protein
MGNSMQFATLGYTGGQQKEKPIEEETHPMPSGLEEDQDIIVDLKYIIENKPKPKVVREFLRENLTSIRSEEDTLFDPDD